MKIEIDKANQKLTRVKIRQIGKSLYVRGTFPPKKGHGDRNKQYDIPLGCKANKQDFKVAVAKAKQIDADLILERWQWQEEKLDQMSVGQVIDRFTKDYWRKNKKTVNREHSYKTHYEKVFGYLPQDKQLTEAVISKAIESQPVGSYKRQSFIHGLRPLAKFAGLEIDFAQFGTYKQPKSKTLPTIETIVETYEKEKNVRFKWIIALLFTYGLRPHELFRSEFLFNQSPAIVKVGENTKTGSRTVYPLENEAIDLLSLDIPTFKVNLNVANTTLGNHISKIFISYPFTAYELRTYYAVRGAVEGISPVTMSKWMGHSVNTHWRNYASYLNDIESDNIWKAKFKS